MKRIIEQLKIDRVSTVRLASGHDHRTMKARARSHLPAVAMSQSRRFGYIANIRKYYLIQEKITISSKIHHF